MAKLLGDEQLAILIDHLGAPIAIHDTVLRFGPNDIPRLQLG